LPANGVKFTRIYTPSPLSAPARASVMTGVYPSNHDVILHRMFIEKNGQKVETEAGKYRTGYKEDMVTWGEYMKEKGFGTAAIGKIHVHGELQKGVNPDFPDGNLMGFDYSDMRFYTAFPGGHYKDWKNNPDHNDRYREIGKYQSYFQGNQFNQNLKPTLVENEEDIFDFAVAYKSNEFMTARVAEGKSFFIHVGLEKPHKPWTTTQRFYDMYATEQMQIPETAYDWRENGRYPYVKKGGHAGLFDPKTPLNENEVKTSMRAYYACVTEMDEAVGRIVEQTKKLGVYDKTIFVYTTDHGEHLFEHGLHEKHNMFEDAVNIPFIISCPALLPKGVTCNSLGSTIDILPTIAADPADDIHSQGQQHRVAGNPRSRKLYALAKQNSKCQGCSKSNKYERTLIRN
jgi:arylsulfatase A-like enzyme